MQARVAKEQFALSLSLHLNEAWTDVLWPKLTGGDELQEAILLPLQALPGALDSRSDGGGVQPTQRLLV